MIAGLVRQKRNGTKVAVKVVGGKNQNKSRESIKT